MTSTTNNDIENSNWNDRDKPLWKDSKPLKVSDWSQKYKLAIYAISGAGIGFGVYKVYQVLIEVRDLLQQLVNLVG